MKDEIKERIKYFKHYVVDNLSLDAQDDFQKILDYITNLQQGYDNAIKQSLADHKYASQKEDKVIELQQENESNINRIHGLEEEIDKEYIQKEDYKSRCEKAIEYIKKSIDNSQPFYEYLFGDENGKVENLDKLLNILQNRSENDE